MSDILWFVVFAIFAAVSRFVGCIIHDFKGGKRGKKNNRHDKGWRGVCAYRLCGGAVFASNVHSDKLNAGYSRRKSFV